MVRKGAGLAWGGSDPLPSFTIPDVDIKQGQAVGISYMALRVVGQPTPKALF